MRPRTYLACAALVLGAMSAWAAPPNASSAVTQGRRVTQSADGGFCSQAGDVWRCRQFVVTAYTSPSGEHLETIARLDQWRNFPNGYAYRHVECPVPKQALRVMPDKAFVDAAFDADSPECVGYGETVTFEPYASTPWLYTGVQTLQAEMLSPANQDRRVSTVTQSDNLAGTSFRENCHGGSGWNLQAGGFTMVGLYRAFGPQDATGSFYGEMCERMDK